VGHPVRGRHALHDQQHAPERPAPDQHAAFVSDDHAAFVSDDHAAFVADDHAAFVSDDHAAFVADHHAAIRTYLHRHDDASSDAGEQRLSFWCSGNGWRASAAFR
jgi:hypothetical protein